MMRWLRRIVYVLIALVIVVVGAGWYVLSGGTAQLDGTVTVAALSAPVTVSRDELGIVTVDASNRRDLAWATGFVHGQARFFQMDLQRRLAAGELAALVGAAALDVDLNHRRHRFRERALAYLENLPARQRQLLDAYAAGVNAGLQQLRVRPWEYLLLGVAPQPWQPVDTLLTLDAMFLDLNGDGTNKRELDLARLRAALPQPLADFLLAPAGRWEAPLQGAASPAPTLPSAAVFDLRDAPPLATHSIAIDLPVLPGSNNFAVSGQLTDGAAIVANDMHLGLRVPNIWFRMQLRYRDEQGKVVELNGVTLPGTPALIVGTNNHIAWAFTNSYGDWLDWVRVEIDPDNPNRYRAPGGWDTLEKYVEQIKVKGAAPEQLVIKGTRWGPIMATAPDGTPLALAWTAHYGRSHNLDLLKLEQAQTAKQALAIASAMGTPPQNFVVGDIQGNIGWTVTGNALPLRAGYDPSLPADWSQAGTGWVGWAKPEQFPRIVNPASGRLWTANNRTTVGAWLQLLGNGGYDIGARAQQIRNDLRAREHFQPQDMLDIQLDDRAIFLTRWQQLLQDTLKANPAAGLAKLQALTADWTGRAAVDSVDYRLVRAFRQRVTDAVLAPFAARVQQQFEAFEWPTNSEAAVWMLVHEQPPWLLDPHYASWEELLLDAAREVVTDLGSQPGGLAARTWGEYNTANIHHPLATVLPWPLNDWLTMPHDPLPGDRHNMPRIAAPEFGASERFGIMPGNLANSYLEMPGGQADNPLSPFFGAGHEAWVHGEPTPLLPGPTQHTLRLVPADG